ncbi:hypothetical protein BCR35DRAFT_334772 [Leucosporidium creatinivorum]|uniref:Uncharacterized protein n=1 Tax=Leucosporidium creatinivorum TaxID=106004 RepID=A0A1Y2DWL3_9BASI|nr:hypothetical protein BCR35DRAFT_334772 [Leucosporidium creatinivorum]
MATNLPQGIYTFPLRIASTPGYRTPTHSSCCIVSEKGGQQYVLYGATRSGWQMMQALTGFCARGDLNKDSYTGEGSLESPEGYDFVLPVWEEGPSPINVFEKAVVDTGVLSRAAHKFVGDVYHKEGTPIYEFRLKPAQVAYQCAEYEKLEPVLGTIDFD